VEGLASGNEPLSEWQIRSIHRLVLKGRDDKNAGRYRDVNVLIAGAQHRPPTQQHVPDEMAAFVRWYEQDASALHPVESAARVHADFVKVTRSVMGAGAPLGS